MKIQGGHSWPRHWMEVIDQLHAHAVLLLKKKAPGTNSIGGSVGTRADMDYVKKRISLHCRESNPGRRARRYPDCSKDGNSRILRKSGKCYRTTRWSRPYKDSLICSNVRRFNVKCPHNISLHCFEDRAVAQAVSLWLPTVAVRVRIRAECAVYCGQNGTEIGFLRVLPFPLPIIIPLICPSS
jgi:hypothetical protein